MVTPCPARVSCYLQQLCQETSHTYSGFCVGNMINLQTAISDKGYDSTDKDHLEYTFVYKKVSDSDKDGACGYWPSYYCHKGETTISNGNYFALCATATITSRATVSSNLYTMDERGKIRLSLWALNHFICDSLVNKIGCHILSLCI